MPTINDTPAIAQLIYYLRGHRVKLDEDLARIYGVSTRILTRAVKRNLERFLQDFMFQLSDQELADLKCQFGISRTWGGRRTPPYAFTEQGVAMLSSILKSKEAALANVQIMRAFVRMREMISTHAELARKLEQLEHRLDKHDEEIVALFEAIKQLMAPLPSKKKHRLGF